MTLEEMGLPKIRQIGIVVKDPNEAMKKYHTLLGVPEDPEDASIFFP